MDAGEEIEWMLERRWNGPGTHDGPLSHVPGGLESWANARVVLEAMIKFSPEWADAWCCYLDGEIALYTEAERRRAQLYYNARHGSTWTVNHDHEAKQKEALWGDRHSHSLDLTLGHSTLGPCVTRIMERPHLAVATAGMWGLDDGVVAECEGIFFGENGASAVGVAEKGTPLSAENTEQLFGKNAWMFLSEVSSYSPVPVHATIRLTVIDVSGIPWVQTPTKSHVSCNLHHA